MTLKHNPALDGVRGLAILLVLLWHCFHFKPENAVTLVSTRVTGLGWLGVDLFFVLSGYLITRILLAERGQPGFYARFYLRRTLRIFPAYYLVLVFVLLILPRFNSALADSNVPGQWPYFVSYLQNWGMLRTYYDWSGIHHFWSLAIEEQFYLVWPLLVAASAPGRFRVHCILLIAFSVSAKLALLAMDSPWALMYVSTVTRLEGLAGGALIATLSTSPGPLARRWTRLIGGLGLLALVVMLVNGAPLLSRLTLVWAIPGGTALFCWLVLCIHQGTLPELARRPLTAPWLRWLGRYSYGIYLWHYIVYWCVKPGLGGMIEKARIADAGSNLAILATGALAVGITFALAVTMYTLLEAPLLRSRERIQHRMALGGRIELRKNS